MRTLQNKSAEPTVVRRTRVLQFGVDGPRAASMQPEHRRALALLRALALSGDSNGARALLKFGGARMELEATTPTVSPATCAKVAGSLRDRGYPLTERGVKLFKIEHGFSEVVRIGPDVARAYVSWARSRSARPSAAASDTSSFEERHALEILRIIGRDADELRAVFTVLGLPQLQRDVDLAQTHAVRLLSWATGMGWRLDERGWKKLARAAGAADDTRVTTNIAGFVRDALLGRGEPEHDYTRKQFGEHAINVRTLDMLKVAQAALAGRIKVKLLRGAYENKGAHPHQGGGVIDVSVRNMSSAEISELVVAMREAGFAAWFRDREGRPHVHAVAIGDREMSASAAWQVRAYFKGRDGRSRSAEDPHADLQVRRPKWLARYKLGA